MPEASSFQIFLRATMPQVQLPDTGQGLGCGRFRAHLPPSARCWNREPTCRSAARPRPDYGDSLALTWAQAVEPAEVEEEDEEENFGRYSGSSGSGWMR
jgi:hypothetical protein